MLRWLGALLQIARGLAAFPLALLGAALFAIAILAGGTGLLTYELAAYLAGVKGGMLRRFLAQYESRGAEGAPCEAPVEVDDRRAQLLRAVQARRETVH